MGVRGVSDSSEGSEVKESGTDSKPKGSDGSEGKEYNDSGSGGFRKTGVESNKDSPWQNRIGGKGGGNPFKI